MILHYKDYMINYDEIGGKIHVNSAHYCGIQCSYGKVFDSIDDLKRFIDNGGWGLGHNNN